MNRHKHTLIEIIFDIIWSFIKHILKEILDGGKVETPVINTIGGDGGYVYFVMAENTHYIKIGWSKDIPRRITQLQTGNASRLTLLGYMRGSSESEAKLHRYFDKYRVRQDGEWFVYSDEIKEFIFGNCKEKV